MFISKVSIC